MTAPHPRAFRSVEVFDGSRRRANWRNKLILGANETVLRDLSSDLAGKVDLVYIDPPFARNTDFFVRLPSNAKGGTVDRLAYRDVWQDATSYRKAMRKCLKLLRVLLAPTGLIYVHCDQRISKIWRSLLDDVFGAGNLRNEIAWCYNGAAAAPNDYATCYDLLLRYSRTNEYTIRNETGPRNDWWPIEHVPRADTAERVIEYPTQKPLELLQRIIESSSPPGGLILDAFCGSGTTLVAAEGLRVIPGPAGRKRLKRVGVSRRWIGCDASPWAVHVASTRLLGIADHRPFEVLTTRPSHATTPGSRSFLGASLEIDGMRVRVHLDAYPDGSPSSNCAERDATSRLVAWSVDFASDRRSLRPSWTIRRVRSRPELALVSPWHRYSRPGRVQVVVRTVDQEGRVAERRFTIRVGLPIGAARQKADGIATRPSH